MVAQQIAFVLCDYQYNLVYLSILPNDVATMFASLNKEDAFKGNILLEISVPQGEKGAYVGYISGMGHSENEVLFDAGRRYRITSVKYDLDGRRIVCATMY